MLLQGTWKASQHPISILHVALSLGYQQPLYAQCICSGNFKSIL